MNKYYLKIVNEIISLIKVKVTFQYLTGVWSLDDKYSIKVILIKVLSGILIVIRFERYVVFCL